MRLGKKHLKKQINSQVIGEKTFLINLQPIVNKLQVKDVRFGVFEKAINEHEKFTPLEKKMNIKTTLEIGKEDARPSWMSNVNSERNVIR